jgi:PAS domain S-box-containing protein
MNYFYAFIRLTVIMAGVCILAISLTTYLFYIEEVKQQEEWLLGTARRIERHIESVVEYHREHAQIHKLYPDLSEKDQIYHQTIVQINKATTHPREKSTVEVTIGRLENNEIKWISQSSRSSILYASIPIGHEWAIPMQLALQKKEGAVKAKDYLGEDCIAGYTYVDSIGLGIVAKVHAHDIKSRFFKGAIVASAPGFLLVIIGVFVFLRVTNPILEKLELDNERYKEICRNHARVEKELKDSEHRFRCFYDGAFEGIAITADEHIIDINDQMITTYGYSREDLIGEPIKKFVHEDDWEKVKENLSKGLEEPYEHRGLRKDGRVICMEVRGKSSVYEGKPVRVTAIHDLTAKKKAEIELEKLRKRQRQTSKMEAIGNFAEGIAHDFNNALTPVIGNCDVLLYNMDKDDPNRRYIISILGAAETASLLVHRIQSFTRDEGSVNTTIPLSLQGCLRETFEFLRSIVPTSIEMHMTMDENLGLVSATDITIRQILMNLCKNAAQAMPNDEGAISIDVTNDTILVERYGLTKGKYVKIEVEDNGEGMSPKVLDRALDPYFTTKKENGGSGIGLSAVNGIVKGYKGYLNIYSEEGKGTRVVVYIPTVESTTSVVRECKIDEIIPTGNGENILLVDDEDIVLEAMAHILTSLNYKVEQFRSSYSALQAFEDEPQKYDLVITDLTMPELTGVDLVHEIQKIRPGVRIILCSGLGSNGKYAADLFHDSIGAYVSKPMGRKQIAETVSGLLKKKV